VRKIPRFHKPAATPPEPEKKAPTPLETREPYVPGSGDLSLFQRVIENQHPVGLASTMSWSPTFSTQSAQSFLPPPTPPDPAFPTGDMTDAEAEEEARKRWGTMGRAKKVKRWVPDDEAMERMLLRGGLPSAGSMTKQVTLYLVGYAGEPPCGVGANWVTAFRDGARGGTNAAVFKEERL
jgi:hypothetical protein